MHNDNLLSNTHPVAPLGLVTMKSFAGQGQEANDYLLDWRSERPLDLDIDAGNSSFKNDHSYLIKAENPRFGSGEAKSIINQSVRGLDLYLMTDVTNWSMTYKLCGMQNHYSPDDHYQDLKRVIAAATGKAHRINVIMPSSMRAVSTRDPDVSPSTVLLLFRS